MVVSTYEHIDYPSGVREVKYLFHEEYRCDKDCQASPSGPEVQYYARETATEELTEIDQLADDDRAKDEVEDTKFDHQEDDNTRDEDIGDLNGLYLL